MEIVFSRRLFFVLVIISMHSMFCLALVQSPTNFFSKMDYTPKESCLMGIVDSYKERYIRFMVNMKSKEIIRLYDLEKKLEKWNKRMKTDRFEDEVPVVGEARRLEVFSGKQKGNFEAHKKNRYFRQFSSKDTKNHHLADFIRKQGQKMLLFGKLYSRKALKNQTHLLEKIRTNWVSTLIRGKSYNQESYYLSQIQNLLVNQFNLHKRYKTELIKCRLNNAPSVSRCESLYGSQACEVIFPGVVHKKCPVGLQRVGCCSCAPSCPNPSFFTEDNYYCRPTKVYRLDPYTTKVECEMNHQKCEEIEGRFIGQCKAGFTRIPDSIECRVNCPDGWVEEEQKCRKPNIESLGTPFLWIKSDN